MTPARTAPQSPAGDPRDDAPLAPPSGGEAAGAPFPRPEDWPAPPDPSGEEDEAGPAAQDEEAAPADLTPAVLPAPGDLDLKAQIRLLRQRRQVHGTWYFSTYPDAALSGLSAVEHYLRFGAALGRNPRARFDTRHYLDSHPEVAASGLNPLVHYALAGEARGLRTRPGSGEEAEFQQIRSRYLALGLLDRPFDDLEALLARTNDPLLRIQITAELGVWLMRPGDRQDHDQAFARLTQARRLAAEAARGAIPLPRALRVRIACALLLCCHRTDRMEEGLRAYQAAALEGLADSDLLLARTNFEDLPERRLTWINEALESHGLPGLRLGLPPAPLPARWRDGGGAEETLPYDRLTLADPGSCPAVTQGPKVTVLMATYGAAGPIRTALRSLREQSWRNLEVIVLDDCGPEDGTAEIVQALAACDPRFRYVRMERNGGAYVARNRGLDLATGDYVTLHDADDWSHPKKIETQVRYLEANPEVMACTSEQARMMEDLRFNLLRSAGTFVIFNTSSLLFRREPVRNALGYWDTVRFAADTEFIARIQWAFGKPAFRKLPTGPLSFQRQSESSVTAGRHTGVDVMRFGVRREYFNASSRHHAAGGSLYYTGDRQDRPFVAPQMMLPDRVAGPRFFDLVVVGDFRAETAEVALALEEIRQVKAAGQRVGLVEFFDYGQPLAPDICPAARAVIDGRSCEILVYGDVAHYRDLRLIGPAAALAVPAATLAGPEGEILPALGSGTGGQDFLPLLFPWQPDPEDPDARSPEARSLNARSPDIGPPG